MWLVCRVPTSVKEDMIVGSRRWEVSTEMMENQDEMGNKNLRRELPLIYPTSPCPPPYRPTHRLVSLTYPATPKT